MFDFQKLEVYQKSKAYNKLITIFILGHRFDRTTNDQLRRASFSIMLNIAEGSSRFSNRDRKNFIVIARGSTFECAAIMEYLFDNGLITQNEFDFYYLMLDELSRMLFGLIKKLDDKK
jgi:four helix bundle protein